MKQLKSWIGVIFLVVGLTATGAEAQSGAADVSDKTGSDDRSLSGRRHHRPDRSNARPKAW